MRSRREKKAKITGALSGAAGPFLQEIPDTIFEVFETLLKQSRNRKGRSGNAKFAKRKAEGQERYGRRMTGGEDKERASEKA